MFYLVGGAVRAIALGLGKDQIADYDYVVVCNNVKELVELSKAAGFLPVPNSNSESGFVEEFDHLGIKALCPILKQVVDIHCARKEFFYTDGAHPDIVEIGTLEQDLERRDFTCNQLLLPRGVYDKDQIIDHHNGLGEIEVGLLRCVGDPLERFLENPDRVVRALRFASQYGWLLDFTIREAFHNHELLERVRKENDDRKVKSLNKILRNKANYHKFFCQLVDFPEMAEAIFSNVGLEATNKKVFHEKS